MRSKQDAPFNTRLQDDMYSGYYALDDGRIIEIHESLSGEYCDDDSAGSVYYQIFDRDGLEDDGGEMEYYEGAMFEDFLDYLMSDYDTTIVATIAMEGEDLYDEIEEAIDEADHAYIEEILASKGL